MLPATASVSYRRQGKGNISSHHALPNCSLIIRNPPWSSHLHLGVHVFIIVCVLQWRRSVFRTGEGSSGRAPQISKVGENTVWHWGAWFSQSLNRALKRHTFIFFQRFKICLPISVRLNSFDILESKTKRTKYSKSFFSSLSTKKIRDWCIRGA